MAGKALVLTTSHGSLGATGRATGFYWAELAAPYWALRDAGYEVAFASAHGGRPPADPGSEAAGAEDAAVRRFRGDGAAMHGLETSIAAAEARPGDYAAVFLPGGHGAMWDLAQTPSVGHLVAAVFERGGVVGAVCHGPAGLVDARLSRGSPLVAGRRLTAFTNAEEAAVGLTEVAPFALETRLRDLGAEFEAGPDFEPHALRDGRLVTGQNPASSARFGALLVEAMREAKVEATA